MTSPQSPLIMLVAGEASGDRHGAHLVQALRRRIPDAECCGIGGWRMNAAGTEIVMDAARLSVVGVWEAICNLRAVAAAMAAARDLLKRRKPDLLILIDYPEFNLQLAKTARKLGIPVLYYVSPQIWAWRSGRVKTIGRRVDHMAAILPFEVPFYHRHGIPATFVGHPLLDDLPPLDGRPYPDRLKDAPKVGLLPGSRDSEIRRLLPALLDAALLLHRELPDIRFILSQAASVDAGLMAELTAPYADCLPMETATDDMDRIYSECTLAIAASGTVTLQTALAGLPMVVIYRVSPVSYHIGKALIQVPAISLVNLIAEKPLVPELIQHDAEPENIAQTARGLLSNPRELFRMRQELLALRKRLGTAGAADRVAGIAERLIRENRATPISFTGNARRAG